MPRMAATISELARINNRSEFDAGVPVRDVALLKLMVLIFATSRIFEPCVGDRAKRSIPGACINPT